MNVVSSIETLSNYFDIFVGNPSPFFNSFNTQRDR